MERLRHIRERAGYSQQRLADDSGVSQHTISEIELGRRKPQGRTLRKLAEALGVSVADLLGEGWREAFVGSVRFRAQAKQRLEARLSSWEVASDEGASDEERRRLLDEVGLVLDEANEVIRELIENVGEGLDRMAEPSPEGTPNPYWEEVREADTLYRDLLTMVEDVGLSVRPAKISKAARLQRHKLEALTR